MGGFKKTENRSCGCILDQWQQLDGTQGKTWQETVAGVASQADEGLSSVLYLFYFFSDV